jgi:hypothetical protein
MILNMINWSVGIIRCSSSLSHDILSGARQHLQRHIFELGCLRYDADINAFKNTDIPYLARISKKARAETSDNTLQLKDSKIFMGTVINFKASIDCYSVV